MKIIKKLFSVMMSLIIIILLICAISIGYSKYIKKDPIVNLFGYVYFNVVSNSMFPKIEKGDIIIIKLDKEYGVGDIVTYVDDGVFITHEIIEIKDEGIITKGKSNNVADSMIDKSDIVGVVVRIIRR